MKVENIKVGKKYLLKSSDKRNSAADRHIVSEFLLNHSTEQVVEIINNDLSEHLPVNIKTESGDTQWVPAQWLKKIKKLKTKQEAEMREPTPERPILMRGIYFGLVIAFTGVSRGVVIYDRGGAHEVGDTFEGAVEYSDKSVWEEIK